MKVRNVLAVGEVGNRGFFRIENLGQCLTVTVARTSRAIMLGDASEAGDVV